MTVIFYLQRLYVCLERTPLQTFAEKSRI